MTQIPNFRQLNSKYGIKVDYSDASKEDITYTVSTDNDVNQWLNELSLSLDDTLYFTVTRNNETKIVEVDVCQFIYNA